VRYLIYIFIVTLFSINTAFSYNLNVYSRNVKDDIGEVVINNNIIMRLYDTIDKQDPAIRAEKMVQRITQLIAIGLNPYNIKVKYTDGYYHGVIGNRKLFTVGRKEAAINQTTEDMLAIEWIEKLRAVLKNMPVSDVKISEDELQSSLANNVPETGYASSFEADSNDFLGVHPSLPVGTIVRVKNIHNSWSIVVKIIGNKVLPAGRVITVSQTAAKALGLAQTGLSKVLISTAVY